MKLTLVATCMFGLEKLLGMEIDALGLTRLDTMDGRVTFEGELKDIPRANLHLRCAERVYIRLGQFSATTFTELFDGIRAIPWEEWIGRMDAFPVTGHAIRSRLTSVPDCQSIIKKAVVERLKEAYGISWFEETGVKYRIEFFLFKDVVSLMIDTSGVALHKRGYRTEAGAAPLRETLAAAVAMTARPAEDILFWDPFCGSGTIAIEAAQIVTCRAPGLNRAFAAEQFANIPAPLWQEAREHARSLIRTDSHFEVYASDIDEDILDITYENALRAGVEEHLNIFQADARDIRRIEGRKGTVVCNPPYGERMGEIEEVERLYQQLGGAFAHLDPWQIYVLTSHDRFDRLMGRRADKVKKLYNGMIPCYLYKFFKAPEDRPAFDLSRDRARDNGRDHNVDRNRSHGRDDGQSRNREYNRGYHRNDNRDRDRDRTFNRRPTSGQGQPTNRQPAKGSFDRKGGEKTHIPPKKKPGEA